MATRPPSSKPWRDKPWCTGAIFTRIARAGSGGRRGGAFTASGVRGVPVWGAWGFVAGRGQGQGQRVGRDSAQAGDPGASIAPKLFIHERCARLVECLPSLQHDPNRPEDVLKVDCDEDGNGGDDTADCLRYLVATKARVVAQRKLRGL